MKAGFVYVLINPAFPRLVKIGLTRRTSEKRAAELSRQTGVPDEFIVVYDELVSDAPEVERRLHSKFGAYGVSGGKEFFRIPIKEAVKALQAEAGGFPLSPATPTLVAEMLPYFQGQFGTYLRPDIVRIDLVQLPALCYLDVAVAAGPGAPLLHESQDVAVKGVLQPHEPSREALRANVDLLKSLDEYSLIMVTDLFTLEAARDIADRWERPGGLLEQERRRR